MAVSVLRSWLIQGYLQMCASSINCRDRRSRQARTGFLCRITAGFLLLGFGISMLLRNAEFVRLLSWLLLSRTSVEASAIRIASRVGAIEQSSSAILKDTAEVAELG